jgi:hypothetical protein
MRGAKRPTGSPPRSTGGNAILLERSSMVMLTLSRTPCRTLSSAGHRNKR